MGRRIGVIAGGTQWRDRGRVLGMPHRHVVEGLRRIGAEPVVVSPGQWPLFDRPVEAVLVWNGLKGRTAEYVQRFRDEGTLVFAMEHGWFDRRRHVQVDAAGFSHAASWATAERLSRPAPPEGRGRFVTAWGREPLPVAARGGYVLVLLQVPADAQLRDSEIRTPDELVRAAGAAGDIRIRPHPQHPWDGPSAIGGTLAEAVAGAAFCVTINSTAGVEALAMGCPVLCLGPSVYGVAGAAGQTTVADMPEGIGDMRDGWCPEPDAVKNFLFHLACRQWSLTELADGWPLADLLNGSANHEL